MTSYNPPSFFIPDGFNSLFFSDPNTNNYLTYPVSQQTDETFLGSVKVNNNLTVTGKLEALNALSTVTNSNNIYVTPTSSNTNYYIPLISSITAGNKQLLVDSNTTFYYNPVTDSLTSNTFTGATMKTNSYQGLTTSSTIIMGTIFNALNFYGKGIYNAILSSIVPTITIFGAFDAILKLSSESGSAYMAVDGTNLTFNIEVDPNYINTINMGITPNTILNLGGTTSTNILQGSSISLSTDICGVGKQTGTNRLNGTNIAGPMSWRNTSLSADVSNIDASGNLFVKSISNFGTSYALKTINQSGYLAVSTPSNISMNATTSNQAMTTNLVSLLNITLQPGVWIINFNAGFNVLTGPCVITGYKFGFNTTVSGIFDNNSVGNIQSHVSQTYAANDNTKISSSFPINLTVATGYTLYGTSIYSSGTFNFSIYHSILRIS